MTLHEVIQEPKIFHVAAPRKSPVQVQKANLNLIDSLSLQVRRGQFDDAAAKPKKSRKSNPNQRKSSKSVAVIPEKRKEVEDTSIETIMTMGERLKLCAVWPNGSEASRKTQMEAF